MIRRIILHGKLRRLWRGDLYLDADTVAEAVSAMCHLTQAFNPTPGSVRHKIVVAGCNSHSSLFKPLKDDATDIHLFPAFAGGKQQGTLQIVVGVVLIVASFFMPAGGLAVAEEGAMFAGSAAISVSAGSVFFAGVMMAAGGLLSILSPTPKVDTGSANYSSSTDPEASKYLSGPQNTTKIRTRIPILYGRTKAYGQILALGLQAKDVAI